MTLGTTKIPYLDRLWHPTTGCSFGCPTCWARRVVRDRLAFSMKGLPESKKCAACDGTGSRWHSSSMRGGCESCANTGTISAFAPTFHRDRLGDPLRARKPQVIGVSFLGDLFDPAITDEQIRSVYDTVWFSFNYKQGHRFVFLTKQAKRLASLDFYRMPIQWPDNCWLGVSVTNQADADERIPHLLRTPAAHRWVSAEPLVGPVDICRDALFGPWAGPNPGIDLVIAGGESGKDARPMDDEWVRSLRNQCNEALVPFYFKQGSGLRPEKFPLLDGVRHDALPWSISM